MDLVIQIDYIQWPIKSNSVCSGNVSHCKDFCPLWKSTWSLLHWPQTQTIKLLDARIEHVRKDYQHYPMSFITSWILLVFANRDVSGSSNSQVHSTTDLHRETRFWNMFLTNRNDSDPIIPEQAYQSNLSPVHPERWLLRFCWTVRNWCLFLAHPTYWNKRVTSK